MTNTTTMDQIVLGSSHHKMRRFIVTDYWMMPAVCTTTGDTKRSRNRLIEYVTLGRRMSSGCGRLHSSGPAPQGAEAQLRRKEYRSAHLHSDRATVLALL